MAFNRVEQADDRISIRNVIVSVSDKTGLDELAKGLNAACMGLRFYSTGGSYASLCDALGSQAIANVIPISDYTGQPEMQGGLVKTLDWRIYLGLLAEAHNSAHEADLSAYKAVRFDMVVSNLYPFEEVAKRHGPFEEKRQHIDIGGPCMARAGAKNFLRVAVLSSPSDYGAVLEELSKHDGTLSLATRLSLAQSTFQRIAAYDTEIAAYFTSVGQNDIRSCYRILQ